MPMDGENDREQQSNIARFFYFYIRQSYKNSTWISKKSQDWGSLNQVERQSIELNKAPMYSNDHLLLQCVSFQQKYVSDLGTAIWLYTTAIRLTATIMSNNNNINTSDSNNNVSQLQH